MFIQEIRLDLSSVVRLKFLGEFFNNFLPGSLGGDAVKAFYVMRHTRKKGATIVSIFADRFVGLIVLTIVSVMMMLLEWVLGNGFGVTLKTAMSAMLVIVGAIVLALLLSLHPGLMHSRIVTSFVDKLPFASQIRIVRSAIYRYRRTGFLLVPIIGYSTLSVLFSIFSICMIAASLQIDIRWHYFFLYIPIIFVLTAFPITPGGIGVMEESFLFFFSTTSGPNEILALVLLYRLSLLIGSTPGAILFLLSNKLSNQALAEGMKKIEEDLVDIEQENSVQVWGK